MANGSTEALRIERRADGVAVVLMDVPGEPVNTLKATFVDDFARAFSDLERDPTVKAVVFGSAKKDCFIAGADIAMLQAAKSASEAEKLGRAGQQAMNRIEAFPKPVVAAIHGSCLGGGLETAMACHARVTSSSGKTKHGLPEAMLGLLPGAGGTQRLPRLVGVQPALDMMLTGKQIDAKRALKMGLVDDVCHPRMLLDVAADLALSLVGKSKEEKKSILSALRDPGELTEFALAGNPVGRMVLFDQARKQLHKTTRGLYPAQDRILDVVRAGLEHGFDAGLAAEAKAFGELTQTKQAEALMGMFFATTSLKKDSGVDDPSVVPSPVKKVGVLGAGLMGAGIAYVTAAVAKTPVRLKDRDAKGVLHGLAYARGIVEGRVQKGSLSAPEGDELVQRISGTTSYVGFDRCDLVIEAVFEDLGLKQRVLAEVEAATREDAIFASNTSSIPITEIAAKAKRPGRVLGMHYFSPVHKMPLLEVIATAKTEPEATATAVELGKAQGKHVVVVNDGPGFYTTRVLAPMLNEAAFLLAEGVPIERVDTAMLDFGFPVGPIKLTDEVWIDVGAHVGGVLVSHLGDRLAGPEGVKKLLADERLGRKNGRGFYLYGDEKKRGVDPSVYATLGVTPSATTFPIEEIQQRCALQFVNEAALCFGEGILRSARDGDVGGVFGLGFPPFRGGPFRFVDQTGAGEVVRRLEAFAGRHGKRFAPAPVLVEMSRTGATFHGPKKIPSGRHRG